MTTKQLRALRTTEELIDTRKKIYGDLESARKICSKCNVSKLLTDFFTDKTTLDGLYSSCKACKKELRRLNLKTAEEMSKIRKSLLLLTEDKNLNPTDVNLPCTKQCSQCKEVRKITDFLTDRRNSSGFRSNCNFCNNLDHKTYRENLKRRSKDEIDEYRRKKFKVDNFSEMKKCCFVCKEEKLLSDFNKNVTKADGYTGKCKSCKNRKEIKKKKEKE